MMNIEFGKLVEWFTMNKLSLILTKLLIFYLDHLQKICGIPWYESTYACFYELHLLTLDNINDYHILLFMFSYYNSLLPKSLYDTIALIIKKSDMHSPYTRSSTHNISHHARINTISQW